ncbi:hypothetical protein DS745_23455 [Anaerobacillus alkaliphilus]|uniref:HEAT repeat domain-containing protein n=1 Tax=Anaerobacillus alkaliphilus TaxID=1548597 RepID=A0A4Q0VMX5_9BACI|nr:hypothetical protein [Anaerobacillus alkaliphilus]RXI96658.1 hypothetical protein DS745_23455 [Anaerobacillus alkaliphilus]
MEVTIANYFELLASKDKDQQYEAYQQIVVATEKPVDWAYEVWDQLIADLTDSDNHRRSRAAQFLCRLAISDPEKKILEDFSAIWEVTRDKKFVTARHCLQSIWRIGLAGEQQRKLVLESFKNRFLKCEDEKNYTLIRFDMIQGLRNLFDQIKDEEVKELALSLIENETDPKYQKKYAAVWKNG